MVGALLVLISSKTVSLRLLLGRARRVVSLHSWKHSGQDQVTEKNF